MKFRAHETFFIRKGWLSKGMKYVKQTDGMVFIDRENNPMDTLGIGSNMVKSLRYWLLATGLTEENTSGKRIGVVFFILDKSPAFLDNSIPRAASAFLILT